MITTSGPSRFIPTKKNIASSLNYVPSPLPPPPISGPVKSSNQPLIETALVSRFKAVCRPPLKSISETGHPSSTTFAVAGGQSRDEVQFYNIIDGFSAVAEGSEVEGITSGDTTSTSTSVGVGAQLPASIHSLPIDLVHIAPVSVAGSGEGEDDSSNCLVVTASKDSICAWQLDLSAANNNIPIFSKQSVAVLAEDLGRVEFISVMDQLVSVCVGTEVFVFNISAQTTTILEGHLGRVAAARFFKTTMHAASSNSSSESLNCYHRDIDINIVSISDDRTFKIWDIEKKLCIYQSSIISPHPFTSIDLDPRSYRDRFCIGSEDGKLRFYDYSTLSSSTSLLIEPRLLTCFDLGYYRMSQDAHKEVPEPPVRVVSSIPSWRRPANHNNSPLLQGSENGNLDNSGSDDDSSVSLSDAVVAVKYEFFGESHQTLGITSSSTARLIAGCIHGIFVLDVDTYSIIYHLDFRKWEAIPEIGLFKSIPQTAPSLPLSTLSYADMYSFCPAPLENSVYVIIGNILGRELSVLRLSRAGWRDRPRAKLVDNAGDISYAAQLPLPKEHLSNFLERVVSTNVKGKWGSQIYRDCLLKLASLGITEIEDLKDKAKVQGFEKSNYPFPPYVSASIMLAYKEEKAASQMCFAATELPINPKSPLAAAAAGAAVAHGKKNSPSKPSSSSSSTHSSSASKSKDKPLTFRSKVKSSGYTQAPKVTTLFTRPSAKNKGTTTANNKKSLSAVTTMNHHSTSNLPPSSVVPHSETWSHSAPVMYLKYHPLGNCFATCSSDRSARIYKNLGGSKPASVKDFNGHDSPVNELALSQRHTKGIGYLMMTGSGDGLVKMWGSELSEPILTLGCESPAAAKGNSSSLSSSSSLPVRLSGMMNTMTTTSSTSSGSSGTSKRIGSMRFFNHDALLVLSRGPDLALCTYSVEKPDPASIKPALQGLYNKYRVVGTYKSPPPKDSSFYSPSITSLACVNTIRSHIVITATSDKSLNVWNVNVGKLVSSYPGAMKRSIHTIAVADYYLSSSNGVSTSNNNYDAEDTDAEEYNNNSAELGLSLGMGSGVENLLVTAALTDSIKLWDIRTLKPVLHLHGHVNRLCSVGVALSPCGKYIVSGSEDNQAYIYDIRQAQVINRLGGAHSEIVSAVDFNPNISEIATGGYDGKIRLWR